MSSYLHTMPGVDPLVPVRLSAVERAAWPLDQADQRKAQRAMAAAATRWRDAQPRDEGAQHGA